MVEIFRSSEDFAPLYVLVDGKKYLVDDAYIGNAVRKASPKKTLSLPVGASVEFMFQSQKSTKYRSDLEPGHIFIEGSQGIQGLTVVHAKETRQAEFETCEARASLDTKKSSSSKMYFGVSDETCIIKLLPLDKL